MKNPLLALLTTTTIYPQIADSEELQSFEIKLSQSGSDDQIVVKTTEFNAFSGDCTNLVVDYNFFEFGFHRFIYGAYRPQVNDLGQKKLILHCLRHNHRPPVWRLFSSILPASIPPVLRSRNAR
ncbi:hypothetical protein T06_5486 [Trichinella sp. T6]|nr:hypothetical protein T06_5486 [Trichinella sp. T6]